MFKESFKYYKSRKPPPDLKEVLNFHDSKAIGESKVNTIKVLNTTSHFFGLKSVRDWKVYEIIGNPGLIYIRNPFTALGEKYWITRCLKDYTKKPNKLNIDVHNLIPQDSEWWEHSKIDPSVLRKLRWATLGYHHDWDTKVYTESSKNQFPEDLSKLCSYIGTVLGFENFNAEAAIVNFYHLDSTLSGHTDHSEQNLDAPLFSLSFGNEAIFLLGGKSIDVKPTALFLHSGDIVVMSKESRLCYHGVPRILESVEKSWNADCDVSDVDINVDASVLESLKSDLWLGFSDYLKISRININVRQVLKSGQKHLHDTTV